MFRRTRKGVEGSESSAEREEMLKAQQNEERC